MIRDIRMNRIWLLASIFLAACTSNNSEKNSNQPIKPNDNERLAFHQSAAFVDANSYMSKLDSLLLKPGVVAPNFTLYSPEGKSFSLYTELDKGEPIILITGSYTCNIARGNLPAVNELVEKYSQKIRAVVIYTIEAHPIDTISPYSWDNDKWITEENTEDGIEADQPQTYLQRRELCQIWQKEFGLKPEILIDNPQNEFWLKYGQAPNMAYIINPDRTVFWRQIWLHPESFEEKIKLAIEGKPST